jgi:hypothetical protein
MAGEYSHELSAKVLNGPSHLIELGFRPGGPADTDEVCVLQPPAAVHRLQERLDRIEVARHHRALIPTQFHERELEFSSQRASD